MRRRVIYFIIGSIFLMLFLGFTFLARSQIFKQFDFDTTVRLQNHIPKKFDTIFSVFSLVGSVEVVSLVILATIIVSKKWHALLIYIPFFTAHAVEILGKAIFHHPGPPFMFFRYNINFLFPSSYVQPGSSYPSGHSLRALFLTLIFGYLVATSKKLSKNFKLIFYLLLIFYDVIMLTSRVVLGEHWTTDVVGGAFLGISAGFFAFIFL